MNGRAFTNKQFLQYVCIDSFIREFKARNKSLFAEQRHHFTLFRIDVDGSLVVIDSTYGKCVKDLSFKLSSNAIDHYSRIFLRETCDWWIDFAVVDASSSVAVEKWIEIDSSIRSQAMFPIYSADFNYIGGLSVNFCEYTPSDAQRKNIHSSFFPYLEWRKTLANRIETKSAAAHGRSQMRARLGLRSKPYSIQWADGDSTVAVDVWAQKAPWWGQKRLLHDWLLDCCDTDDERHHVVHTTQILENYVRFISPHAVSLDRFRSMFATGIVGSNTLLFVIDFSCRAWFDKVENELVCFKRAPHSRKVMLLNICSKAAKKDMLADDGVMNMIADHDNDFETLCVVVTKYCALTRFQLDGLHRIMTGDGDFYLSHVGRASWQRDVD